MRAPARVIAEVLLELGGLACRLLATLKCGSVPDWKVRYATQRVGERGPRDASQILIQAAVVLTYNCDNSEAKASFCAPFVEPSDRT
jgi:hypothetical protein